MEDKPRYSRVSDILDLAIYMSSKPLGVTINEISKRYNVSRRTEIYMPQLREEVQKMFLKKHLIKITNYPGLNFLIIRKRV